MATELYYSDRAEERARLSEDAVAMARRLGDRATIASTLSARFLTLWGPENSMQRLQIASDVVALGEEARDRELVLRGHVWRIVSLMEIGDWVGADIELAIHARLADELRDPLHLWYVPLYQANRAMLEGRMGDAERLAGEAFATGRSVQSQNAAQLYAVQLFALRMMQGRLSEVEQSLEEFARRYPAAPVWRAAAAYASAVVGRTEHARRAFESLSAGGLAEVPRDGEWLSTVALLLRTGAVLGDARRTWELGELLEPYADRSVVTGRGATCLGPVSRFVAIAAAAAGRWADAVAYLEAALETAPPVGRRPARGGDPGRARARARRAPASTRERAQALREQGMAGARRMELHGLLERWETEEEAALTAAAAAAAVSARASAPPSRAVGRRRAGRRAPGGSRSIAAATSGRSARPARRSSCATRRG